MNPRSTRRLSLGIIIGLALVAPRAAVAGPAPATPTVPPPHYTFVLVHGAWGGGWQWSKVDNILTAGGHKVYRPTLTGLGEKVHLASPAINLTTHINDIVNVILFEDLHDIVLVGHSYGGMVITGVMDRVPERIRHVIFLDAFAPNDGESLNATGRPPNGEVKGDFIIPQWVKPNQPFPHDVPHPAKTLNEPVSFRNPAALKLPATYILTVDPGKKPEEDQFYPFYVRAKERGWATLIMEGDHVVLWRKPVETAGRLLQALAEAAP